MDTKAKEFSDLSVEEQEKFVNTCVKYRSGELNAFKEYDDPMIHYVLNEMNRVLKLLFFCKALEYHEESQIKPIIFTIAEHLIEVQLSIILSIKRVPYLCSIIFEMHKIGLLDDNHEFILNSEKEHTQLLAGVFEVLYKYKYFNKYDINSKPISKLRAAVRFFEFFNADFSYEMYIDKKLRKHNINLAETRLPILINIEKEYLKNNENCLSKD